jgi:hypothetical protein
MTLSEPIAPAKNKTIFQGKEWNWTAWDSLDISLGDITLGEFMDYFEKEYNLEMSMLSYGVSILYSFFANKTKVEERKVMKMTEVITSITRKGIPAQPIVHYFGGHCKRIKTPMRRLNYHISSFASDESDGVNWELDPTQPHVPL